MFEKLLEYLPTPVLACRRLYNPDSGGYHLPPRHRNVHFGLEDVPTMMLAHDQVQYDCIEVPVADLIASLVINTHSRFILETGTSRGFSTSHLAAASRCVHGNAARVVTLDVAPCENLMFAGAQVAGSIDAHWVDSLSFDIRSVTGGSQFDFMFLDSLHSYEHLGGEIERFLPLLKVGGLLVLHDTFFFDGLGLLTLMLMQFEGLESISLPTHRRHHITHLRSPGVSIFRKLVPIGAQDIRFPCGDDVLKGEVVTINNPAAVIDRFGTPVFNHKYTAKQLVVGSTRNDFSYALLEPLEK